MCLSTLATVQDRSSPISLGMLGYGAFGRLAARHLAPHFSIRVFDPRLAGTAPAEDGVEVASLAEAARCPVVVLAVPVNRMREAVEAIAPHVRPGALVLDTGSVKMEPAHIMQETLPEFVDIVATHPLFGPQSAASGTKGLKVALCPVRGRSVWRVAAFLSRVLKLEVLVTTPEAHDREAALAQGLTHLIAKVLVQMEPLPCQITTRSFDLLREAVSMVRHDAPEVFDAIARANPYTSNVRRRFFDLANALDRDLEAAPPRASRPG